MKQNESTPTAMIDEAAVATMDSLYSLGFRPEPTAAYYDTTALAFDFGILKLRANAPMHA